MTTFAKESSASASTTYNLIKIFLCGICMGIADIIPGISGGTIAFIMGFYQELLSSIKSMDTHALTNLCKLRFKACFARVNWRFLLPLGLGIVTAFITLAQVMQYLLGHETYRVWLYSGFLGLITASILYCARQIQKWQVSHCIVLLCGATVAYLLTGTTLTGMHDEPLYEVPLSVSFEGHEAANYRFSDQMLIDVPQTTLEAMIAKSIIDEEAIVYHSQEQKQGKVRDFITYRSQPWIDWTIICCGAIAISAMLLPGISGSYLLTILGVYSVAIGAIADLSKGLQHGYFDSTAFLFLSNMGIGIILGALCFARVITFLFRRYEKITIALMVGIMIGAMRSVWPFWSYSYHIDPLHPEKGALLQVDQPLIPEFTSAIFMLSLLFMAAGFLLVYIIDRRKQIE